MTPSYANDRSRYTFLHKHVEKMMGATRLVRAVDELVKAAGTPKGAAEGEKWLRDFFSVADRDRRVWWPIEIDYVQRDDAGPEPWDLTCVLESLAGGGQPFALIVRNSGAGSGKTVASFKAFRDCVTWDPADGRRPPRHLRHYVPLWIDREEAQWAPPSDNFAALVNAVNRTAGGPVLSEPTLRSLWARHPPVLCFVNLPRPGEDDHLAETMIGAVARAYARAQAGPGPGGEKVPHGFVVVCRSAEQEYQAKNVLPEPVHVCSLLRPSLGHQAGYIPNYQAFRCGCLGGPRTPQEHQHLSSLPPQAIPVLGASPELLHAAALFFATATAEDHPRSQSELIHHIVRDAIQRAKTPLLAQDWLKHSCVLFTRVALAMIADGTPAVTHVTDARLKLLLRRPEEPPTDWHPPRTVTFLRANSDYYRAYRNDLRDDHAGQLSRSMMTSAEVTTSALGRAGGTREVQWRFNDPKLRDYFAGVYALYWYQEPGVPRPSQRRREWAPEVVRWITSREPANWLGAASYLAGMLDQEDLGQLLKELLKSVEKEGSRFRAPLVHSVLHGRRNWKWEPGPSDDAPFEESARASARYEPSDDDAPFEELARASARYEPFEWPEALVGLVYNLVAHHPESTRRGGTDLRKVFAEFKRTPPHPWLESAGPVRVPEANSARIHRAPVLRLARLSGNTVVSLGGDGSLACWDHVSGGLHALEQGETPVTAFAVSTTEQLYYGQEDGTLKCYETSDRWPPAGEAKVLLRATSAVRGLCVLDRGLLSVHADGKVLLVPLSERTQAQVRLLAGLAAEPTAVVPWAGNRAVVGDRAGYLHLFSADGRLGSTLRAEKPAGAVRCLEPLNDELFVSGHDSGAVRFWRGPRAEGGAPQPSRSAVVRLLGVTDRGAVAAHEDGTLSWQTPEGGRVIGRLRRAACGLAVEWRTLTAYDGVDAPRDLALPDDRKAARRATGALLLLGGPAHLGEELTTTLIHGTREGAVETLKRAANPGDEPAPLTGGEAKGAAAPGPDHPDSADFRFLGDTGTGVIVEHRRSGDGWRRVDARQGPSGTAGPAVSFREPVTCFHLGAEGLWISLAGGRVLYWDGDDVPRRAADCRADVLALVPQGDGIAVVDATGYVQWLRDDGTPSGRPPWSLCRRPTAAAAVGRDLLLGDVTGGITIVPPPGGPEARERRAVSGFAGPVKQLVGLGPSERLAVAVGSCEARAFCSGPDPVFAREPIARERVSALETFPIRGGAEGHLVVCGLANGGMSVSTVQLRGAVPLVQSCGAPGRRHKGAVTAVAVRDPFVWATGAADGMVLLWRKSPTGVRVQTAFVSYGCIAALRWFRGEDGQLKLFVGLRDGRWNVLTEVGSDGARVPVKPGLARSGPKLPSGPAD